MTTSPLERLSTYVRQHALAAGYDIDRTNSGEKARLARDAGMSETTLSRLLAGKRMPDAKYLAGLATAIGVNPIDIFIESDILPAKSRSQDPHKEVASSPITPDEVADAWGVDAFGREMVHAMFERLRKRPLHTADHDDVGSAEAQG